MVMENMRKKVEWLENNDVLALTDLWDDYMDEISYSYNIYEMDDFDEAFGDLTPKEIMRFSDGNFNPDHTYYAFNEDNTAYISFDDITDYEPYMKRREDFIMFLVREGYCF